LLNKLSLFKVELELLPERAATSTPLLDDIRTATTAAQRGKYPPAEPGALESEPLEAAGGVADAAPFGWAT
jgi:hypothetical protein